MSSSAALSMAAPDEAPRAAPLTVPYQSFWMGGFEGADHRNEHGTALDMVRTNGHLERLDEDYEQAAARGLRTVRESVGWRLCEDADGRFDFARIHEMSRCARKHDLQILWTLMHYGTPEGVSLFDDDLPARFARFAAAVAGELADWHGSGMPPVYTPVNEINFLSWAATETRWIHPYAPGADAQQRTEASGYDLKRRLVRASLAAIEAIREVDPRARFLHIEPCVHVVAPPDRPDLEPLARQISSYQWQAWDMLAGRSEPELGGHPRALDLIGVNYYHSGQWEALTEKRLWWHLGDPRRRRLSALLRDNWERYRRPLIVAETGHFGVGRADWLNEVATEVRDARRGGVPVHGICLYPLVDRHDWNRFDHWHNSGLWDVAPPGEMTADASPRSSTPAPYARQINAEYAEALARWQASLPHIQLEGLS